MPLINEPFRRTFMRRTNEGTEKRKEKKMTQKKNKVSEKHFGWLLSEINGSWRHKRKEIYGNL